MRINGCACPALGFTLCYWLLDKETIRPHFSFPVSYINLLPSIKVPRQVKGLPRFLWTFPTHSVHRRAAQVAAAEGPSTSSDD